MDHEKAIEASKLLAKADLLEQIATKIMLVTYDPIDKLTMKYMMTQL